MRSEPTRPGPPPPDRESVLGALSALHSRDDLFEARLVLVVPVGSWADGEWRPGDDVDLRALYVLPTASYLGLTSFRDEIECCKRVGDIEIDLVAFEAEKAARLILKGHPATLEWLSGDTPALTEAPGAHRFRETAARRLTSIGSRRGPPPRASVALRDELDDLVRRARLDRLARDDG